MKAINLKTEHLRNPLGIDVKAPVLSWNDSEGIRQTAYQVVAFCKEREVQKEIWNTGKVSSDKMRVIYGGSANSRNRIFWRVKLWNEQGAEGEFCEPAFFEYALLHKSDFQAKWMNPEIEPFNPEENQPASVLKKTFMADKTDDARLYATAHGMYVLYLNGKRVTENVLTPGTSEYWKRLPYQTFDVSAYLHAGENIIEVTLGDGWYRGRNGNTGTRNVFGTDIALLLQLEIGKEVVLVSDETWTAAQDGPIYFNDIQLGERVDARKRASKFHGVKVEDFGYDNLICANTLPIREKEEFDAKLIVTPNGEKVLDFGQNMAGYVSFQIEAKAGQTLRFTYGECLGKEGNFCDDNLQTIGRKEELHQVVEYICKDGMNTYTSTLCIFGFQMVKVETDVEITGREFKAHAVYSDMEQTAEFKCGNALVNQLVKNTIWSEKSNFVDVPTDCPQRERSGWTGDAGVFVNTGLILMDSYPVFSRWLSECRSVQYKDGKVPNIVPRRSAKRTFFDELYDGSTGWGDASIIIPYTMYQKYGDVRILEENYEMMRGWLGYCEKKARKSRWKNKFKRNPYKKYTIDTGVHWGEWLEAGISMQESVKAMFQNGVPEIATAYFSYSSRMMGEIAEILGKEDDAKKFKKLAHAANNAFHIIEVKDWKIRSDRQCRYVRPLYMGLLDAQEAKEAAKDLNQLVIQNGYHLNTGFLTTPYLCKVLADHGYIDTAYKLLLQEDAPGWLYAVKKGATTIWESWEGNEGATGVASLNHYSKGAVVSWLFEGVCGIRVKGQKIIIRPQVSALLGHADAVYDASAGRIESRWEVKGSKVEYRVTIPANTRAVLILPDDSKRELQVGKNEFSYPFDGGI